MANLLLDAANWTDGSNSPPSLWNGTAYVFTAPATITYGGTVVDGDVLDSTFTSTPTGDVGAGHLIAVKVNGVDAITWTDPNQSYPTDINFTLAAGDTVQIVGQVDGCGYPPTFTITPTPVPVPPDPCAELGRVTKCYVSGYNRGRVHQTRLMTGEKRCLVADFNGALSAGRTIASVRWRCDIAYVAAMSDARIPTGLRSTEVDILAQWIGSTMILCEATLDNGEIYTQMFMVDVSGNPYFLPSSTTPGPLELTATA